MFRGWKPLITKKAEFWISRHQSPLLLRELGWQALSFLSKCGKSNPLSFCLRLVVEHPKARRFVGIGLVTCGLGFCWLEPVSSFSANTGGEPELVVISAGDLNPTTVAATKPPVASISISQRYWLLHPGVDLQATVGTKIMVIMDGKVEQVVDSRTGYGKHVIVTHANGYKSLYAHMSKILVSEGQMVSAGLTLGEVGSTGRSTGPHLHLEIRDEEGRAVNPMPILGI